MGATALDVYSGMSISSWFLGTSAVCISVRPSGKWSAMWLKRKWFFRVATTTRRSRVSVSS